MNLHEQKLDFQVLRKVVRQKCSLIINYAGPKGLNTVPYVDWYWVNPTTKSYCNAFFSISNSNN